MNLPPAMIAQIDQFTAAVKAEYGHETIPVTIDQIIGIIADAFAGMALALDDPAWRDRTLTAEQARWLLTYTSQAWRAVEQECRR